MSEAADSSTIDLLLDEQEVRLLTAYERPHAQLGELHRQGFWRARINRIGRVVLERAHYEAVCAGQASAPQRQPQVRNRA